MNGRVPNVAVAAMCALCIVALHAGTPFSNVVDRVCEITFVSEVGGESPYTQVDFTLRPEKGSEILCRMALPPPSRWNGEFWGVGNSSLGGTIRKIAHYAQYGFAVATTDLGTRRYVSGDLKDEYLSDVATRDYSWRATHFMTVYGKRIAKSFYGRPHKRAYFVGGSCGGRQAMCEAMRYPDDYDGIIASIPAGPVVANAFQSLHRYLTTHDGNGNALVTPQQLSILADAPIEYMKGKEPEPYDGNFLSCPFSFTPADIEGVIDVAAKKDPALGAPDLRARLRKFFLGLSRNGRVLCHGLLPGTRHGNPRGGSYRMTVNRSIGRPDNAVSPSVEWLERIAAERGGEINSSSFDLSAFRDRGGKLFITVGLEDQTTHTPSMIAWYEMMCERMGGFAEVQKFCRLFAMPGVAHGGGEGRVKRPDVANRIVFPLVRAWVESGNAPEAMPLAIRPGENMPVPPYPLMAYKDGSGAWKTKMYPKGAVRHPDPSLFKTDLEPWKRSGVDKDPPEAPKPESAAFLPGLLSASHRKVLDFNEGWEFAPDGWAGVSHRVDLPHDFQLEMPWQENAGGSRGFKPMGAAKYRNKFETDAAWKGSRVFLDFEGIMCVGDVWVNGEKVAAAEYGYLGFEVDVTKRLKPAGGTNIVEVWASTGQRDGSRWYTGGGLYRPVRIKTRPARSIARHGIFVSSPKVSGTEAKVRVQVELDGFRCDTNRVEVFAALKGPDGSIVGEARGYVPFNDYRSRVAFALPDIRLVRPALWDIDAPRLHTAEVRLVQNGRELDSDSVRFGIRKIEFSPVFGFRLNGRKVFLKSMSNHSDYGAVGVAQFPRAIERELRQMKAFGFNAVRCSHNPYAEAFYRIADKLGILVVDEFIDKWSRGERFWSGRRPFLEVWPELLTEWVRRDRNHPCVILWSLGNELQHNEQYAGYDTGDWGVTTYRIFDLFTKRLDPTRLTTIGLFPSRAGAIYRKDPRYAEKPIRPPELSDVMDVASFNYRYEDYADYFKWNPNLILFQSEASTSKWLEPYFAMDRDRTVGVSWWGAIEYWGESNRWPKKGWNYSFFSHTLEPKPQAYLIRSGLEPDVPLTRIAVMADSGERLIWNDIHSGQYVLNESWNVDGKGERTVFAFSNAEEVELLLNGKALGKKSTVNNVAKWERVKYEPGRLEARGANGSSHAIETTGKVAALEIVEEAPGDWKADGVDLKYVRIYAVDAAGRRVPDAAPLLRAAVDGPATLLALDNGDHFTDESFAVREKAMKDGFLLAILRAGRVGGEVLFHVEGEAISPASLKLSTARAGM